MTQHPFTNDLANETSPYLLQHAHNPVNWMPWGDAAWEKAKKEDKLVIVSIGYSACHWCHVMEHESFEDEAVAKIMNDHFISIKVDREERPDVDQIYMDAVQIITGQGGWPLNAICLPDGRPVYAGTYFQREHWKQLLAYMDNHFKNQRDELLKQAAEITRGIHVMDKIPKAIDTTFTAADREAMFSKIDSYWDHEKGGRRGAPKFPMPVTISYLLRNYFYTRNIKALQAVTITLDNMAAGGIYDHVGGGFARYSVDDSWTIPHFEKMLYDNAQLVSLYAEAYQATKNERYKQVVYETLEFIARELTDPSGGFYSALDADSEGEEGKYYVWTYDELKQLLGEGFEQFCSFYDINPQGNFEHGTINLRLRPGVASDLSPIAPQLKKLFVQRSHRIRPGLDDKILTSWNALMLKGYVDAYRAFGEERFLGAAIENANFLKKNCIKPDYSMTRNHKQGRSTISGFLDDYALTIDSFIALYQVTFDEQWLTDARSLADHVIQHFYAADKGIFYYTSINDAPLIARKTETSDNVIPSSNAIMAKVLHLLGHYVESDTYLKISKQQVMNMKEYALSHTAFYAQWAMLTDWFISPLNEVAIVGSDALALRKKFDAHFLPNCIWLGTQTSSELPLLVDKKMSTSTFVYVCKNKTCSLPMVDFEAVLPMLQAR